MTTTPRMRERRDIAGSLLKRERERERDGQCRVAIFGRGNDGGVRYRHFIDPIIMISGIVTN